MAISRADTPYPPTLDALRETADIGHGLGARAAPVGLVARSLVMISAAAFAILVLLPALVAAQATVHI